MKQFISVHTSNRGLLSMYVYIGSLTSTLRHIGLLLMYILGTGLLPNNADVTIFWMFAQAFYQIVCTSLYLMVCTVIYLIFCTDSWCSLLSDGWYRSSTWWMYGWYSWLQVFFLKVGADLLHYACMDGKILLPDGWCRPSTWWLAQVYSLMNNTGLLHDSLCNVQVCDLMNDTGLLPDS
jgi:hypothetical protein